MYIAYYSVSLVFCFRDPIIASFYEDNTGMRDETCMMGQGHERGCGQYDGGRDGLLISNACLFKV